MKGPAAGFDWDISFGYGRNELDYRVNEQPQRLLRRGLADAVRRRQPGLRPADRRHRRHQAGRGRPVRAAQRGLRRRLSPRELRGRRRRTHLLQQGSGRGRRRRARKASPASRPPTTSTSIATTSAPTSTWKASSPKQLTLGGAARYEDYSDFGDTADRQAVGPLRLHARVRPARRDLDRLQGPGPAAAVSSATSPPTWSTTGRPAVVLQQNGTFRVNDPIAIALGAKPLEAGDTRPTSRCGAVLRHGGFELTVDAYRIDIDGPDHLLRNPRRRPSEPVGGHHRCRPGPAGAARRDRRAVLPERRGHHHQRHRRRRPLSHRAGLSAASTSPLAANFNSTEVTTIPDTPPTLAVPPSPNFLFDRANILRSRKARPSRRSSASVDWTLGNFGATAKVTNYDSVLVANNNVDPGL